MGRTSGTPSGRTKAAPSRREKADGERAAATWRDGVQIAQTPLWCDAYRARDICFVSCADAVKPSKHGQVIATEATLALLSRPDHRQSPEEALSVPLGRPFTLGTVRLELFANGHAIGSAGLWLSVNERRVSYAGTVCPQGGGLGGPADIRAAETLVIRAPYGSSEYRFPDPKAAAADVVAFCHETPASAVAVLLVSSAVKGLDVARHLVAEGIDVWAARQIQHASRRLARAGIEVPEVRRFTKTSARPGRVLVWPLSLRDRLPSLPEGSRLALVSGEATRAEAVSRTGADVGIGWSNCADFEGLVHYIEETGAREVFVLGRHNEELSQALDGPARRVRPLGPPKQLSLL